MKKITYILVFLIGITISCNDSYLTEKPKDFLSPENAFTDEKGFKSAIFEIYRSIRSDIYGYTQGRIPLLGSNLDIFLGTSTTVWCHPIYYWNSSFNADNATVLEMWRFFYKWIYYSNVIIERAEGEQVTWTSQEEKNAIVGEARFLRAFAYRLLANIWGGVPLVLEETTSPVFNYTRATQEAVYQQCREDLEYATQWMHTIDELEGGRAPRAAAYHLLAEIQICLKEYDKAIEAANKVIDDPNFHIMTERFGVRTDFRFNGWTYQGEYEPWGDVYWDLFREGNMNYREGNFECIWNIQLQHNATGGGGNLLMLESHQGEWRTMTDINGIRNLQKDTLSGRPNSGSSATYYATDSIWRYKGDWDRDIRNSKYNIQREFYWVNPESEFYGQQITVENLTINFREYISIITRPCFKKVNVISHYGDVVEAPPSQKHDNNYIWKDWYIIRLPETYFLRAEAYMLKGDLAKAAEDINVIRNRAQATPVTAEDINMDLILDERARELHLEDFRLNTLMRVGKLKEYLMKYNPEVVKENIILGDHINKFPIPNREIEANKELKIEQNPGY
jgi:hypothetical protein